MSKILLNPTSLHPSLPPELLTMMSGLSLGHFQDGRYCYRGLIEGLYTS